MSDQTGIEWTDKTWNPWHGCTKVSPGCAHCYMYREKARYGQNPEIVQRSKTKFNDPLRWHSRDGARALVFTCSWSDFFHEAADAWRDEAWAIIKQTPRLTYQILTKRPERIAAHLPDGGVPRNVWLGVSVENQRWVDRIDYLRDTPAVVRFVSAEPLLGPLSLDGYLDCLNWVIVGGESGPDARPMKEEWARKLRDECADWGVRFFLKQLGGHPDARAHQKAILDGQRYTQTPNTGASQ